MRTGSFFLALLGASITLFGQVQIRVPDVKGLPGTKVIIPINLVGAQDVSALQFSLEFDPAFLSAPAQKSALPGDLIGDHSIGAKPETQRVRVVVFSTSLSRLKAAQGCVVQVVSDVAFGAPLGGNCNLVLKEVHAADPDGNTLAVSVTDGKLTVSNQPNTPSLNQNQLIFPQTANGAFSGGSFQTTIVLVNSTGAPSTVEMDFRKSGDVAWEINLANGWKGSRFTFTVPPAGSTVLRSDGTGSLEAGYARLTSTGPLTGTILFQMLGANGSMITEAGVAPATAVTRFEIPVLYLRNAYDTGIALFNVNGESVQIDMRLKRKDGEQIDTRTITAGPYQHTASFSREFFTSIAAMPELEGSIDITAAKPIAAVALKQAGLVLTTFPIALPK